ncbi:zinc knuckle CX2CX4HX4C containing protein [Tanacetum coccineum]|uniref:Zinc knuckle CX2CX4HX4C containing protein n=1 Tax=Tanacetum coccineum TaxID=301880 RepID=A0ABQ5DKI4_9ASTR
MVSLAIPTELIDKNVEESVLDKPAIPVNTAKNDSKNVDNGVCEILTSSVEKNTMNNGVNEYSNVHNNMTGMNVDNTQKIQDVANVNSSNKIVKEKLNNAGHNSGKFVDVVAALKSHNKLQTIPTEVSENGDEVVIFDDEIIEEGSNKWNLTVCGQFVGCSMSLNEVRYHPRRMWNKFGLKDIIMNDSGIFFFKFHDNEGINEVINNGPWMVKDLTFVCTKVEY